MPRAEGRIPSSAVLATICHGLRSVKHLGDDPTGLSRTYLKELPIDDLDGANTQAASLAAQIRDRARRLTHSHKAIGAARTDQEERIARRRGWISERELDTTVNSLYG
jgi:hypothetical protein